MSSSVQDKSMWTDRQPSASNSSSPVQGECSSGACNRPARKVIRFMDGRKLSFCTKCARAIRRDNSAMSRAEREEMES